MAIPSHLGLSFPNMLNENEDLDHWFFFFLFLFFVHLFTCAYIVWVISPRCLPPSVSGRSCSALITDFVEEKT
jgi:hypothetical protein